MFYNSFHKDMEMRVVGNRGIDPRYTPYTYAYTYSAVYRMAPLHFLRGLSMQYSWHSRASKSFIRARGVIRKISEICNPTCSWEHEGNCTRIASFHSAKGRNELHFLDSVRWHLDATSYTLRLPVKLVHLHLHLHLQCVYNIYIYIYSILTYNSL